MYVKCYKLSIIYLISFLLFCYEIPDNYSVVIYPHVVINTSIDTVFMRDSIDFSFHSSDTLIADYSSKQSTFFNVDTNRKIEFVDTSHPPEGYFDLLPGDTFHIMIIGISEGNMKLYPVYDTNKTKMISFKNTTGEYSFHSNEFSFKAKSPSKGYIFFFDKNYDSITTKFISFPNTIHTKVINICYCISTHEKVNLKIDSLEWSYLLDINGSDTIWNLNRVNLKGKTDAFSLQFVAKSSMSSFFDYSDIINIAVDENGGFTSKYGEFDEEQNKFELYIQAFPERDKKITLVPPKSKGDESE